MEDCPSPSSDSETTVSLKVRKHEWLMPGRYQIMKMKAARSMNFPFSIEGP
jgi:hypothetical protein